MLRYFLSVQLLSSCLYLSGCNKSPEPALQGYVEGDYVRVGAAVAGRLDQLPVTRGQNLQAGSLLFTLDSAREKAMLDQAQGELQRSTALLADLGKGKRASEIAALTAQWAQAQAARALAESRLKRQQKLAQAQYVAPEVLDEAATALRREQAHVRQLSADLETARLGGRSDMIVAAQAAEASARAGVAQAEWNLAQTVVHSVQGGQVTEIFYRPGEWVNAGNPVVEFLPPNNIKVRAFIPEPLLGGVHYNQKVRIVCDACAVGLEGQISYIAPVAEFTPPVTYSLSSRQKFVFMVEIQLPPDQAAVLHPGQPVAASLVP